MSVKAVGAYIEKLVDRNDLKVQDVTEAAGVRANYIWRLRTGAIKEPAAHAIAALVQAVRGSMEDATRLLLDANATIEDGERAALKWFSRPPEPPAPIELTKDEQARFLALNPDQRRLVMNLIDQMRKENE